jgi:hypothetical protein
MSHAKRDTEATPANADKTYIEIIDFSGPPNKYGLIHVQIAVFRDKDMTDLIDVRDCHSVGVMNRTLGDFTNRYGLAAVAAYNKVTASDDE